MSVTACIAALAILAQAARPPAQHTLLGDSQLVVGDGVASKGSEPGTTGATQQPFVEALAALGGGQARGGTIEVLPGTYVFDAPVVVGVPGVRIHAAAGARVVAGPGLVGACFQVQAGATDLVLEGLTLEDRRDPPPVGVTLVDVRADRFSLLGCRVLRSNRLSPPARSVSVGLGEAGGGGVVGARLVGNRFLVGKMGDGVEQAVPDARGVCMLSSLGGRGLRLQGNAFESAVATSLAPVAFLQTAVSMLDEREAVMTGNTFSNLSAHVLAQQTPATLVETLTSSGTEGRLRLTFQGNFAERLECLSMLHAAGQEGAPARVVVSGNVFGRVGVTSGAAVYLERADGSVVSDNGFHIIGQDDQVSPAVYVTESANVGLLGNAFSLPRSRPAWFSQCTGVLVRGNQFSGTLTLAGESYLHLDDVAGASIVQNRFAPEHCPAIQLTDLVGGATAFVCGNTFAADCGSGEPWEASGYAVIECDAPGTQGNPID